MASVLAKPAEGIRFHRTMLEEFYRVAFRKKLYTSLEQLQQDADEWVIAYNCERPHAGRYCYGKTPMQTLIDSQHLATEKVLDQQLEVKPSETTELFNASQLASVR